MLWYNTVHLYRYRSTCRASGTERGNRLLPILLALQEELRHHVLAVEVSQLKVELVATARSQLQQAEADTHRLRAELRYRQGRV